MIDADSKSRMRENRTYGSVRGEVSNGCPLLDVRQFGVGRTAEVEFPARQSLASSRYLALEQKP